MRRKEAKRLWEPGRQPKGVMPARCKKYSSANPTLCGPPPTAGLGEGTAVGTKANYRAWPHLKGAALFGTPVVFVWESLDFFSREVRNLDFYVQTCDL